MDKVKTNPKTETAYKIVWKDGCIDIYSKKRYEDFLESEYYDKNDIVIIKKIRRRIEEE